MRHLVTLFDYSTEELQEILRLACDLKGKWSLGIREPLLAGRVLGLLFEKPSLRTRVSFEAGMAQLGGSSLFFGQDVGWGNREPVTDFARVLSQYVDAIVCRTFDHQKVIDLAEHCTCSVINGLTDRAHPCQALADLMTMQEQFGELQGRKLAFVGDANNVARSLAIACGKLGVQFAIARPQSYRFDDAFGAMMLQQGLACEEFEDPRQAVRGADAVYTDVWTSMGQESESTRRKRDFANMQVNAELMREAPDHAIFLHCLPAHRGEEVTSEVIDGQRSRVIEQAGNRMHAQKGLLVWLLKQA